jgi:DNA-binding response OmpR family regulator
MTNSKILVVEDDEDLRRGLEIRLRATGYDVVLASDGLSAVTTARDERPDLVVLDIGLPGGNGLTVLERYSDCAALMFTPVVVLTGRDPVATEAAVRKYGVAGFLTKPAKNEELRRVIERALRGDPDPAATAAIAASSSSDDVWPPPPPKSKGLRR